MKRDMNLIRAIVVGLNERDDDTQSVMPIVERIYGSAPSEVVFHYHLALLLDAGFIEGSRTVTSSGMFVLFSRLTWAGHEFADMAASETGWAKVVGAAQEKSAKLSFEFVKAGLAEVAKFTAKQLLASQFGSPS